MHGSDTGAYRSNTRQHEPAHVGSCEKHERRLFAAENRIVGDVVSHSPVRGDGSVWDVSVWDGEGGWQGKGVGRREQADCSCNA